MYHSSKRRSFIRLISFAGAGTVMGRNKAIAATIPSNEYGALNTKATTILFQGDSITDGNRGRTADPNHIMGHGYAFSIASRVGADFPSASISFFNRGISGNKITDLQQRWEQDALSLHPDVLSILVGINDAAQLVQHSTDSNDYVNSFESAYHDVLTQSKKQNPSILFVLGLPFVYNNVKGDFDRYQSITKRLAERVKKLAAEFNAVLVDYPAAFNKAMQTAPVEYWIWDGIHPTVAGHEIISRAWIKQVSTKIKLLKKYHY